MSRAARTTSLLFVALCVVLFAQSESRAQDRPKGLTASVTYGPYARLELGGARSSLEDAYWLPPGQSDPLINFDASASDVGFGAVGIGFDWQNGVRADLALFGTGTSDVSAPCSSASDGSPCSAHAEISSASVNTTGVMANLFYAPLEARGSHSIFQPFVVGGLGIARNEVGDWTRSNLSSGRPTRTFEGDASLDFAWSIGAGLAVQVTRAGRWPVIMEAAWRYYDYGTASGSATPVQGSGNESPREPFSFRKSDQVISLGLRIPLQRY